MITLPHMTCEANNNITRESIWSIIRRLQVPEYLTEKVKVTYKNCIYCVKTNARRLELFETSSGMRQGRVLSSVLFNVIMDKTVTKI
jgi:hypothetical protein